jgi:hypothetical protein
MYNIIFIIYSHLTVFYCAKYVILFNMNEGVLFQCCFENVIIFNNAIIFSYCVRGLFHNRPLTLFTFHAGKIHSKPPTNETSFIVKCIYYTLIKTCLFSLYIYFLWADTCPLLDYKIINFWKRNKTIITHQEWNELEHFKTARDSSWWMCCMNFVFWVQKTFLFSLFWLEIYTIGTCPQGNVNKVRNRLCWL